MDKLREIYDRYPMTVVRVTGFVLGVPAVCITLAMFHVVFGLPVYQRLYVPVIVLLAEVFLYFLRKATARHIKTDHENWDTSKSKFYNRYCSFLGVLMVFNVLIAIIGLLEG